MATIASLDIIFRAQTAGVKAGVANAAKDFRRFETSVTRTNQALQNSAVRFGGIGRGIDGALKSLTSFNSLFKLGVGVGVGEELIGKLRHGIGGVVEGFDAASKSGKGFVDSLREGLSTLTGMETATAKAAAASEALAKSQAALLPILREAAALRDKAIGVPAATPQFPNIPDPASGAATMERLMAAVKVAREAARPAQEALTKARSQQSLLAGMQDNVLTRGGVGLRQSMPAFTGLKVMDQTPEEVARQHRGVLFQLQEAERQLAEYTMTIQKADDNAKRVKEGTEKISFAAGNAAADLQTKWNQLGNAFGPALSGITEAATAAKKAVVLGANNVAKLSAERLKQLEKTLDDQEHLRGTIMRANELPLEAFQRRMKELDEAGVVGPARDLERMRALGSLRDSLPDRNQRAGAIEFGSREDFSARLNTPQAQTERDILTEAKQQSDLQRQLLDHFTKTGEVTVSI